MALTEVPIELSSTPGIVDNSNATAITIDSSEKVGIGTTSPAYRLDVQDSSDPAQIRLKEDGNTNGFIFKNFNGNEAQLVNADNGPMVFKTNDTERMRIDSNGNAIFQKSGGAYLQLKDASAVRGAINVGTSDGLIFTTGASFTERMRIDSSGNVGIGTTSAYGTNVLNVNGGLAIDGRNASTPGLCEKGDLDTGIWWPAADTIAVTNGGSESMRIDSSGNLLVGKTSADNTTQGVRIYSTGRQSIVSEADTALIVNRRTSDGTIAEFRKDGTNVGRIGTEGGNLTIDGATGTGKSGIEFSGAEWLPRDGGANTNGAISLGDSSNRFNNLYLSGVAYNGDGSASAPSISFGADTNTGFYRIGSDQIGFVTGGSLRAKIDASGDVFIGRTSSGNTGNGHTIRGGDSAIFSRDASGETMQIGRNANDGDLIRLYKNGTQVGSVSVSGSTTAYNTSSDQRLKENIVDAPSAADDIDAIQVRSFDWKADGSHQKYGMVAQELVTVAPSAVSQPEDPEEMMSVDYSKLVPMMLKEIQQLRARVAQLEGEN